MQVVWTLPVDALVCSAQLRLSSDGQPLSAELQAPGTTAPGQVGESMGSLSSGGRQGRFGKDHTARCPGLLTFPPVSTACRCWEWSLGLDRPLA